MLASARLSCRIFVNAVTVGGVSSWYAATVRTKYVTTVTACAGVDRLDSGRTSQDDVMFTTEGRTVGVSSATNK